MNKFIQKLIGFSIGPIVGAFIAFITIPLTTHFIDPDEFGKASMFSLFQSIIITFIYLGIDQSYTREFHSYKNKDVLFRNAILFPLLFSLIIFVVICINLRLVSKILFGANSYYLASLLFGVMIICMVLERFLLLSIRMEEKALEYSLFNILIKVSILIFTLFFIFFVSRDFLSIVYSTALGQILGDIYLMIKYRKLLTLEGFQINKKLINRLLKFGIPLILATSITSLLNSLDRLFLRLWSNFSEIGVFTATLKISAVLTIIQTSFTNFWVPTSYRWYSENKDIKYFRLVSDGVLLFLSVVFFCILIFKSFIVYVLSPEYVESKYIIGFLCLQPIMYTLSETTTLGIVFSGKSYLNIWVSVISIIPNVLINICLVPKFGAIGAAIATGISYIFFFWGRSFFSNKNWIGFPLRKHFLITIILLVASFINTINFKYIIFINLVLLIMTIILQVNSIKEILNTYLKSRRK